MDGVLVDSEALYLEGMAATATERGVAFTRDLYVSLVGHPGPECVRILAEHYGPDFPIKEFWSACGARLRDLPRDRGAKLKPGAAELFDALDALAYPEGPVHLVGAALG